VPSTTVPTQTSYGKSSKTTTKTKRKRRTNRRSGLGLPTSLF
jgi:hypothetical protein